MAKETEEEAQDTCPTMRNISQFLQNKTRECNEEFHANKSENSEEIKKT